MRGFGIMGLVLYRSGQTNCKREISDMDYLTI